jgi:hypothetical protein
MEAGAITFCSFIRAVYKSAFWSASYPAAEIFWVSKINGFPIYHRIRLSQCPEFVHQQFAVPDELCGR